MAEKLKGDIGHQFKTPQEAWLIGSTDSFVPGEPDWYRPMGIHKGLLIPELQSERDKFKYFSSSIAGIGVGLNFPAVITLEQLNQETGETLSDPRLVGYLDNNDDITSLDSSEWTRRMVGFFIRTKSNPFYR